MGYFYSASTVQKTFTYKQPDYTYNKLLEALKSGVQPRFPTLQAGGWQVKTASVTVANSSFRWGAATQYSLLPPSLRNEPSMNFFL